MAVDKVLGTEDNPDILEHGSAVEVEVEPSRQELISDAAQVLVSENEILVGDELEEQPMPQMEFTSNLVEFIDESILNKIASDLISSVDSDKQSRSEWEKTYTEGLQYLGMKFDESRSQPFEGSSGVIHPILAEAVTQFQAQAYKEMLPAERVQEFMNYYIMNVMQEYDPELDMLLFYLPLAGSAFKKVYFDFVTNKAISKFIPPEDLIVPYEASDISSAERITHAINMSTNEVKKLLRLKMQ